VASATLARGRNENLRDGVWNVIAPNAVALAPGFVFAAVDGLPCGGFRGRTLDAARGRTGRAPDGATVVAVFKRLGMRHVGAMISQTMNYEDTHGLSDG
jgi:hypothetical protein